MIDSAARERMQEAKDDFHGMLSSLHEDVPVLVLANKQDVKGAMTVDEISKVLYLDALRQNSPATKFAILGCAVHNGENLTEAMQWICAVLREGRASGRFPKPRTDPA
jgi:signal recognition particle receptor subunit beta